MRAEPSMSVVVVTPGHFAQIRQAVRHLADQDVARTIELVIVAPSAALLADHDPAELDPFGAVQTIEVGPIPNVDRAAARGMLAATADIVAVIEDHGFVQPGWARTVIGTYRAGPWASVGPRIENANPRTGLSWANLLLGYGWWIDAAGTGEVYDVASHNGSYRRAALAALDGDLADRMGRNGDLHDRLRAHGGRMYLAAQARVAHLNPSTLSATADLRFHAGRLYGAQRARRAKWSFARRLLYAMASPLIPLVRFRQLHAAHFAAGRSHAHLVPRILPGLMVALFLDAAGQAAGYLRGPGRAPEVLAVFEMDRLQHLTSADRQRLVRGSDQPHGSEHQVRGSEPER